MIRSTTARVARLEAATASRRSGGLLVASDQAEADRLRAQHPSALIIITGVPRASRSDAP